MDRQRENSIPPPPPKTQFGCGRVYRVCVSFIIKFWQRNLALTFILTVLTRFLAIPATSGWGSMAWCSSTFHILLYTLLKDRAAIALQDCTLVIVSLEVGSSGSRSFKPSTEPNCLLVEIGSCGVLVVLDAGVIIGATTWENLLTCAHNEDSNQPVHPHSLISLCCPHEENLHTRLSRMYSVKILIRVSECPGWSVASLGSHAENTF